MQWIILDATRKTWVVCLEDTFWYEQYVKDTGDGMGIEDRILTHLFVLSSNANPLRNGIYTKI